MANPNPLSPGDEIGGYRLTSQIGEGGMGVVYLAEHKLMGRKAAIKVLLPAYSKEPELTSRFFNEARAATAIRHAGIVEIYDFGHQPDGTAYIVMEYLEGESLDARIRRAGRVDVGNTLHAARQIASALSAAHAKSIVHRDLKPDNIFMVPDRDMPGGERIKVLDFGIAKLTESDSASGSVKTRTGVVMGTPAYMSPEQCKGAGEVDHRADLYSLGCIMFEMLGGRPPFMAEGAGEVIAKHIYEQPPAVSSLNPTVPQPVDGLVTTLLAKQAEHRYQAAEDLINAIDQTIAAIGAVPSVSASYPATGPHSGGMRAATPPPGYNPTPAPGYNATPAPGYNATPAPGYNATPAPGYHPTPAPTVAAPSGPYAAAQSSPPHQSSDRPGTGPGGTVALPTQPPQKKSRTPLVVGVVLVLAAAGIGGAVVLGGGNSSDKAAPEDTAGPVAGKAPTDDPGPPGPPPAADTPKPPAETKAAVPTKSATPDTPPVKKPKTISIVIDSSPKGASVYQQPQGIRVGKTPYTRKMNAQQGELVFLLSLRGYANRTLTVQASEDSQQSVVLKRIRSRSTHRSSSKKPPTRKPTVKKPPTRLNPFETK